MRREAQLLQRKRHASRCESEIRPGLGAEAMVLSLQQQSVLLRGISNIASTVSSAHAS